VFLRAGFAALNLTDYELRQAARATMVAPLAARQDELGCYRSNFLERRRALMRFSARMSP